MATSGRRFRRSGRTVVVLALLGSSLTVLGSSTEAAAFTSSPTANETIRIGVAYDASVPGALTTVKATVARTGGTVVRVDGVLHFAVVTVPAARRAGVETALAGVPAITHVEEDAVIEAHYTPNDQHWPYYQWGPKAIGVDTAWETGTSSTGAPCTVSSPCLGSHQPYAAATEADRVIAILDTGIDFTHPDIALNYCYDGPNYYSQTSRPMDDHGHGTAVAGSAAAGIDNWYDIAGVANTCVVAVKVLGADGTGSVLNLASGIRWAADNGVDVINMSLGNDSGSFFEELAIDYAWSKGVLMVASAGNDSCTSVNYPAAYPKVIAVGALSSSTQRSEFSDCGPEVDLVAPGDGIVTLAHGGWGGVVSVSGTSIASPHVAGAAALVWDRRPPGGAQPAITAAQVRCVLSDTAEDLGPAGHDNEYGDGRVDVDGAMAWLATHPALPSWPTCTTAAPAEPPRTEEDVFKVGNDVVVDCTLNLGGVCFAVRPGDSVVDLSIDDITPPISGAPGSYRFLGYDGAVLGTASFCGTVSDVAIPLGSATLEVRAGGAVDALNVCGLPDPVNFGFIEARFNGA